MLQRLKHWILSRFPRCGRHWQIRPDRLCFQGVRAGGRLWLGPRNGGSLLEVAWVARGARVRPETIWYQRLGAESDLGKVGHPLHLVLRQLYLLQSFRLQVTFVAFFSVLNGTKLSVVVVNKLLLELPFRSVFHSRRHIVDRGVR
jgi:hypothetical protein